MPCVIPDYEYDIFVSYRHKDNKYDGWVTEFVNNLRKEIEATFKEDISLYFDENPYDGLLETHLVDDSLQKKLKCLVFIPVISQTYCDEKSFAWQSEFLHFLKSTTDDRFGLKIELTNGNVGSRILPVRIHEIEEKDQSLIESHLGGPMRSIDFIYRSAGVNRPLRPKDDDLKHNDGQALYRNQVNKVANAVKDIISGMATTNREQVSRRPAVISRTAKPKQVRRRFAYTGVIVILLSLIAYAGHFYFKDTMAGPDDHLGKSIAIIPFRDLSADKSQQYFGDGIAEMIRTHLSRVSELSVTSMQSVIQYRDSKKTITQIGDELKVRHVLEGSILKDGNSIRVIVQLIEAGSDKHIWSETYDGDLDEIFAIQSDISNQVVTSLKIKLTDRERADVKASDETTLAAYDYILAGRYNINRFLVAKDAEYIDQAVVQFKNALTIDSTSIEALAGLGRALYSKSYLGKGQHWLDSSLAVAEKILKINSNRAEGYALLGRVLYDKSEPQKAKVNLEEALERDPNKVRTLFLLSYIYREERNFKKGIPLAIKAVRLSPSGVNDDANPQFMSIGNILFEGGYDDLAEQAWKKHAALYPDNFEAYEALILLKLKEGNRQEAKRMLADHVDKPIDLDKIDDVNFINYRAWLYYLTAQYDKAERYLLAIEKRDSLGFEAGIHTTIYKHRLAHIYRMKGEINKSEKLFKEHLTTLEQTVKAGKSRFGLEYDLAGAYAFLGDKEKAYYWLDKMPYTMSTNLFIQIDPLFDPLRHEIRFQKILEKQYSERGEIRRVIELEKVQQDLRLILR